MADYVESLYEPLLQNVSCMEVLAEKTTCVEVLSVAKEWKGLEDQDSSDDEDVEPMNVRRSDRYARMAQDLEEAGAAGEDEDGSAGGAWFIMEPYMLRCWGCCFSFVETSMNLVSLALLVRGQWWVAAALLAPPNLLVMSMHVYLARKDRTVAQQRRERLRRGAYCGVVLFEAFTVVALGCLNLYSLMLARHLRKSKGKEQSFLDEIEAQDPSAPHLTSHGLPNVRERMDCHSMFISGVPSVVILANHLISESHRTAAFAVYVATIIVCQAGVVHAVVNFDYYASRYIQRQYELSLSFHFQALHCAYRLFEVSGRILVLVAVATLFEVTPVFAASATCLDFTLGALALRWVSKRSTKIWLLSIPIFVVDVSRYIDGHGFALPAQRLSTFLHLLRNLQFLGAAWVFWQFVQNPSTEGVFRGGGATTCLVLLLLAHLACFVLRMNTQVGQAGTDLFMAAMHGEVELLESILEDDSVHANMKQHDTSQTTVLNMAASHGQLGTVIQLLDHRADPCMSDANGENALHAACRHGDPEVIQTLLQLPDAQSCITANKKGKTPLQLLTRPASLPLFHMLEGEGASPVARDPRKTRSTDYGMGETARKLQMMEEEKKLFGPTVGGEHYCLRKSEGRALLQEARTLGSYMFSKGVGEQLSQVLDELNEQDNQIHVWSLKTLGPLGSGAFGRVLKVMDVRTGDTYAMKIQKKDRATDVAVQEAQTLHRSNHAFIVRLERIFHTSTCYGILMELCEENLNTCILEHCDAETGRSEGLPDAKTARYTVCVMLALEYLHRKSIVFRDLKPENVLVTAQDKGDYAKLADFGLACCVKPLPMPPGSPPASQDSFEHDGGLDSPGSAGPPGAPEEDTWIRAVSSAFVAGTFGFMAAEVFDGGPAEGRGAGNMRSRPLTSHDWYALGCCLFLMVLGERGAIGVKSGKRKVLLPPPEHEVSAILRVAVLEHSMDEHVFLLVSSLMAPAAERADSEYMRASPFLQGPLAELEHEVERHGACAGKPEQPPARRGARFKTV